MPSEKMGFQNNPDDELRAIRRRRRRHARQLDAIASSTASPDPSLTKRIGAQALRSAHITKMIRS